jgi:IS4 transposase
VYRLSEQTPQLLRSKGIPNGQQSIRYTTPFSPYTGTAVVSLGETFERFLQNAPISVMFRALLERAIDPTEIDRLFERTTTRQYTREILFSSIVKLMGSVVCGVHPSIRAAYLDALGEIAASLTAVYEKLQGIEPEVCRGFVTDCAGRLRPLVQRLETTASQPVSGYRAKVLDGNHLAGTEHRPAAVRTTRAAALPGQALAVLDLASSLIVDVVPCEDAYTQERALIDQVLPGVEPQDLWIGDRNLCTTRLIFGVHARGGSFLVRQHQSTLYWSEVTPWEAMGRAESGTVSEQTIQVEDPASGGTMQLRRIRLDLDRPTREKETTLFLLTDLPRERAGAALLCQTYRRRWRVENIFQALTEALRCEIDTLAYPKAALFGFCTAVVAYNVLAVVRAALGAEHGPEVVEAKVSTYYLAHEVDSKYDGMMIALPPSEWKPFRRLSDGAMVEFLREVASQVWLAKYPRSRRGPKKPPPKKTSGRKNHHVSTARELHKRIQQE